MRWWLVHLEMEPGDFAFAHLTNGSADVEAMFYPDLQGPRECRVLAYSLTARDVRS